MKFATQFAAEATDTAVARILFGNISPSITHMIGPHVAPKETTKRFAATSATVAHGWGRETSSPVPWAWEKATAMVASVTAMPAEPAMSSGRRPTLSTRRIATMVTRTLVTEVMTEVVSAWLSSKPTERHSVVE